MRYSLFLCRICTANSLESIFPERQLKDISEGLRALYFCKYEFAFNFYGAYFNRFSVLILTLSGKK